MPPGTLYIVSTPIGNLEDITLRALRILKECDLIAAEDTRVTRKLLSHFDIHTPLTSYHQHTREDRARAILSRLADGAVVALVSDAGTPAVSDPGAELIQRALSIGAAVVPVPGPSAALSALVASGLPTGRFAFDGFPPRGRSDRREFFQGLSAERRTLILYEAPSRIVSTLEGLRDSLGDRRISVAREVTKRFEEHFRGTITEAIARFRTGATRGELTLVIEGAAQTIASVAPTDVSEALKSALARGLSGRDAVQEVAENLAQPRKQVYAVLLGLRAETPSDS